MVAFAGVFAAVLCCFLAIGAVLPVLPRYVHGPLGAGDVAVGVVVGAFAFTAVVGRPDRRAAGRRARAPHGRRRRRCCSRRSAARCTSCRSASRAWSLARLVLGVGDGWVFTAGRDVDRRPRAGEPPRPGDRDLRAGDLGRAGRRARARRGAVLARAATTRCGRSPRVAPLVGALVARRVPDQHVPVAPPAERASARRCCRARSASPGVALALANVGYGTVAGVRRPAPGRPRRRPRRRGLHRVRRRGRRRAACARPAARPARPAARPRRRRRRGRGLVLIGAAPSRGRSRGAARS